MGIISIVDSALQKLLLSSGRSIKLALLLGISLVLFGCLQQPLVNSPNFTSTVFVPKAPENPLDTIALCFVPEESRYACNVDEDCICENAGVFVGNKFYYEHCADKSKFASDHCGGFGPLPVACISHSCTTSYPPANWTFENCDGLSSERTKTLCKRELVRFMANQYTDETFCNLMKPERLFNQTQCKDLFFDTKAYADKNSTWCERIVDPYERRTCNP